MLSQLCQLSSSSNLHRINEPAKTKIMPKPWCHTHKHLKELANMQFGTPCLYIAAQLPHIARDAYSTDENNLRMHFAWDKFGQLSDTHKLTLESCMWSIQSSYCLDAAYLHQNQTYTTTPTHHLLSICAVPIDGEKMLCNQSAHFESLLLHVIRRHCRTPSRGLAQNIHLTTDKCCRYKDHRIKNLLRKWAVNWQKAK